MIEIATTSAQETKKVARFLAREVAAHPDSVGMRGAAVLALSGELGAGKTTFAQGFAQALGIKEKIKSPTFVLMKIYDLKQGARSKKQRFRRLIHIDCYRIKDPKDLLRLGLKEILGDHDAIILIEWADRIEKILPCNVVWIKFMRGAKSHQRTMALANIDRNFRFLRT